MSRPLVRRLALSVIGFLVCAVAYVGLGWSVWSRQDWLHFVFTQEQQLRLFQAYANAASALFGGDRDGDGYTDGSEVLFETDPNNPSDHIGFRPHCADRGFQLAVTSPPPDVEPEIVHVYGDLLLRPDETCRVRMRLVIEPERLRLFARDFRVELVHPEMTSTFASVERHGWLNFDLTLPPHATTDWRIAKTLIGRNPATGEKLFEYPFRCTQSFPPVAAHVEDSRYEARQEGISAAHRAYKISWPRVLPAATDVLIEATPQGIDDVWTSVVILPSHVTSCTMEQMGMGEVHYLGPLKFRAVPIR